MREILEKALPDEKRHDILESIFDTYNSDVFSNTQPELPKEQPSVNPNDTEPWLESYNEAIGVSIDAHTAGTMHKKDKGIDTFLAFHTRFINYLRNNPNVSFANIALKHRKIAAEQEDIRTGQTINRVLTLMPKIPKAIVIDSRLPCIDINTMLPEIEKFAHNDFYVSIINNPNAPLPLNTASKLILLENVIILDPKDITIPDGTEDIVGAINTALKIKKKEEKIPEILPFAVSIVSPESDTGTNQLIKSLQINGEPGTPSYVIIGKNILTKDEEGKRLNRIIPMIAAANLLKRYTDSGKSPHIIAIECSENTLSRLKQVFTALENISRLRISETIREFIDNLFHVDISA
ncbi:MAG: hypothetical protein ABIH09_01755 [Candidatus Omnitrophota bacterium]